MMEPRKYGVDRFGAILICVVFILLACAGISRLGVQTDEALFAGAIYPPIPEQRCIRILGQEIPLMVFDYVGALKSALYVPVLALWGVSAASVRFPAILIGAVAILMCFELMRGLLGRGAALMGALLLAADPMFLLTVRGDWGPVALQIACKTAGLLALAAYGRTGRERWLAAGFFVLGLGLWDKALFVWPLAGLAAGAAVLPWGKLSGLVSGRRIGVAAISFVAGCSPLLAYNLRNDWVTFRGDAGFSLEDASQKVLVLRATFAGEAMRGIMARTEANGWERGPSGALETATVGLATWERTPQRHYLGYLLGPALILALFLRGQYGRVARFSLAAGVTTWVMMLATAHAGGAVHHTVLLYPYPQMLAAAVLSGLAARRRVARAAGAAAVLMVAFSGVSMTARYYADEIRYGGTPAWSDAFYGAMAGVKSSGAKRVCLVDWGLYDNLRLFQQGRVELCTLAPEGSEQDRRDVARELRQPATLYAGHTEGQEVAPGSTERLLRFAEREGYEPVDRRVYRDRTGRPVIETFRMQRSSPR